jgi:hypothetical protein
MHVDNTFDHCPVCKHQFLELCIHDYFYYHRRERKEEGKRKDGCLVNDDNNKTETQWKLLHQPRVPLPPCCFLSYHAPNPLFRLVLRQISTYNRRLTSASQNGWKNLNIFCRNFLELSIFWHTENMLPRRKGSTDLGGSHSTDQEMHCFYGSRLFIVLL